MFSLLKFLIIVFIVYYVIRFFLRYLLPMILGHYVKKKMSEMEQFKNDRNKKTGEVTINDNAKNKKQYSKNSGEYIDFEEIK